MYISWVAAVQAQASDVVQTTDGSCAGGAGTWQSFTLLCLDGNPFTYRGSIDAKVNNIGSIRKKKRKQPCNSIKGPDIFRQPKIG